MQNNFIKLEVFEMVPYMIMLGPYRIDDGRGEEIGDSSPGIFVVAAFTRSAARGSAF